MSSHDKVERVLKDIHVAFSQCKSYNGQPDKIIVDRKQFLELLDRLNMGIFDMLEEYEHTRQSRDKAERDFRRKGEAIIKEAKSYADDIYASSMLYTVDMIGHIQDVMDKTSDSMEELFRKFRRELRDEKDMLKQHESELESQLTDLADTRKYLKILEDINQERRRRIREFEREKNMPDWNGRSRVYTPATQADVKINEKYQDKTGTSAGGQGPASSAPAAEKPDIVVNKDAAYFKWKESQKAQESAEEKEKPETPEETKEETIAVADVVEEEVKPEPEEETPETAELEKAESEETEDEKPNPEFPNEEAIMKAVLADELAAEQEDYEKMTEGNNGSLLKRIIFGKQ